MTRNGPISSGSSASTLASTGWLRPYDTTVASTSTTTSGPSSPRTLSGSASMRRWSSRAMSSCTMRSTLPTCRYTVVRSTRSSRAMSCTGGAAHAVAGEAGSGRVEERVERRRRRRQPAARPGSWPSTPGPRRSPRQVATVQQIRGVVAGWRSGTARIGDDVRHVVRGLPSSPPAPARPPRGRARRDGLRRGRRRR